LVVAIVNAVTAERFYEKIGVLRICVLGKQSCPTIASG